jgi:hypothetical protein
MRRGAVGMGSVRFGAGGAGQGIVADGSTEGLGPPCCSLWGVDEVWRGLVRRCEAGCGMVRLGKAKGASAPFLAKICSLWFYVVT